MAAEGGAPPDVVGWGLAEAEAALRAAGWRVDVVRTAWRGAVPGGLSLAGPERVLAVRLRGGMRLAAVVARFAGDPEAPAPGTGGAAPSR